MGTQHMSCRPAPTSTLADLRSKCTMRLECRYSILQAGTNMNHNSAAHMSMLGLLETLAVGSQTRGLCQRPSCGQHHVVDIETTRPTIQDH
jgi:hypothetical protein